MQGVEEQRHDGRAVTEERDNALRMSLIFASSCQKEMNELTCEILTLRTITGSNVD